MRWPFFKARSNKPTPREIEGLERYTEEEPTNQFLDLTEIVVKTEKDKQQLLLASQYIHDLMTLDTDYVAVNFIAHLYLSPELIKVSE